MMRQFAAGMSRLLAISTALMIAVLNSGGFAQELTQRGVEKKELRYEGESFETWAHRFQTELEPMSLNKALSALSTFAPHGYQADVVKILGKSLNWELAQANHQQITQTLVRLKGWEPLKKEIARERSVNQDIAFVTLFSRRRNLPNDVVEALFEKYSDSENSNLLAPLCGAVGGMVAPKAKHIAFLLKQADHPSSSVQRRASSSFGIIPLDTQAYAQIRKGFSDLAPNNRLTVGYYLLESRENRLKKETGDFARSLLDSSNDEVRLLACRVLGSLGESQRDIRKVSFQLMRSPDLNTQSSAFGLLAMHGVNTLEVRDLMKQFVVRQATVRSTNYVSILRGARKTNSDLVATLIGELLDDNRVLLRGPLELYQVLQEMGPSAEPALDSVIRQIEAMIVPPKTSTTRAGSASVTGRPSRTFSRGGGGYPAGFSGRGGGNPLQYGLAVLTAIGPPAKKALPMLHRISKTKGLAETDRYSIDKTIKQLEQVAAK